MEPFTFTIDDTRDCVYHGDEVIGEWGYSIRNANLFPYCRTGDHEQEIREYQFPNEPYSNKEAVIARAKELLISHLRETNLTFYLWYEQFSDNR